MEVLKTDDVPLLVTNLEAMQLLRERIAARRQSQDDKDGSEDGGAINTSNGGMKISQFKNRDWIERAVLDHLESSPIGGSDIRVEYAPKLVQRLLSSSSSSLQDAGGGKGGFDSQSRKDDENNDDCTGDEPLSSSAGGFGLTKSETLQVLNNLPTTLVEVHLLIDELDEREQLNDEGKQMELLTIISKFSGRPIE